MSRPAGARLLRPPARGTRSSCNVQSLGARLEGVPGSDRDEYRLPMCLISPDPVPAEDAGFTALTDRQVLKRSVDFSVAAWNGRAPPRICARPHDKSQADYERAPEARKELL